MVNMDLFRENHVPALSHLTAIIVRARTVLFYMNIRQFEQWAMMVTDLALLMGRYISKDLGTAENQAETTAAATFLHRSTSLAGRCRSTSGIDPVMPSIAFAT